MPVIKTSIPNIVKSLAKQWFSEIFWYCSHGKPVLCSSVLYRLIPKPLLRNAHAPFWIVQEWQPVHWETTTNLKCPTSSSDFFGNSSCVDKISDRRRKIPRSKEWTSQSLHFLRIQPTLTNGK